MSSEAPAQDESQPSPAREHLLLREYFHRQIMQMRMFDRNDNIHSPITERLVDLQIDRFMKELKEKLQTIHREIAACQKARSRYVAGPGPGPARDQARKAFDRLEDAAGSLHGMLRHPLSALRSRDGFRPVRSPDSRRTAFAAAMARLIVEFEEAEARIVDYFVETTNTVHQEDLSGENMLIHLDRVRKLAEFIKKGL